MSNFIPKHYYFAVSLAVLSDGFVVIVLNMAFTLFVHSVIVSSTVQCKSLFWFNDTTIIVINISVR